MLVNHSLATNRKSKLSDVCFCLRFIFGTTVKQMSSTIEESQCPLCKKTTHVKSSRSNGFVKYRCYNCKEHQPLENVHAWIQCPCCVKTFQGKNSQNHASRHMTRVHGSKIICRWKVRQGYSGGWSMASNQHIAMPPPAAEPPHEHDLISAADSDASTVGAGEAQGHFEQHELPHQSHSRQCK